MLLQCTTGRARRYAGCPNRGRNATVSGSLKLSLDRGDGRVSREGARYQHVQFKLTQLRVVWLESVHSGLLMAACGRSPTGSIGKPGSSRDASPESSCRVLTVRGGPISTGWNSTAAASVQTSDSAISWPMLDIPGKLDNHRL